MVLAVTVGAAAANWLSRLPDGSLDVPVGDQGDRAASRWLEWLTKPAVTIGLLALAALAEPASAGQQRWFLVGLAMCLVGDVALMLPTERFRTGLIAFLLGHIAFVAGFLERGQPAPRWSIAFGAVVLVACLAVGLRHLLPSVRRSHPALLAPVGVYVMVIAVMAVAAWWGGHWAAPLGAATFAVSDLTLADNKFVIGRRWSPVLVMMTYHLALLMLVASLG